MKNTTYVNLHCHSILSDGELSPEALAEKLALAGVEYASLTDHDSIDGLFLFQEVLKRYNIGFLSGVEITTQLKGREIHLLAYGFDVRNAELSATLDFLRHQRRSRIQGALRQMPSQHIKPKGTPAPGVAQTGQIDIAEAIDLVHRAGGRAFFAHPLTFESEPEALADLFAELKTMGMDGVEGIWEPDLKTEQEMLHKIVSDQKLLLCAGTDFHKDTGTNLSSLGVHIPTETWKQLVQSIISTPNPDTLKNREALPEKTAYDKDDAGDPWPFLHLRISLPSIVAVVLFVTAIWGMILPSIEDILIDRKRDMIRELTNTAVSLLTESYREERVGWLSRGEAQEKAKAYIGALRYGDEGKDYFWIQDMQPKIIMHPYRADLNGQDVSGFTDPTGNHIFVEFAKIVKAKDKGFAAYVWQWKDDPKRLAAKESYVRAFKPWGWVIGTGMYIDDVMVEIKGIKKNLVYALSVIVVLVFFVLLFNIRQSLKIEKKRKDMQASLEDAKKRYRSLIEVTTEGTLLIIDGRCRYGNPTLLNMTGYTAKNIELLELSDILPRGLGNEDLWAYLEKISKKDLGPKSFDAILAQSTGEKKQCVITLNPIDVADRSGLIVLVKEVYFPRLEEDSIRKLGVSLLLQKDGPDKILKEIAAAKTTEDVVDWCRNLFPLIKTLLDQGAHSRRVAHIASKVCDAATTRFVEMAIEEMGPPPVAFTFIAMGSQGRQEQTLLTDQDNAIIYEPDDALDPTMIESYFLMLGKKVCDGLDQAGYAYCPGKVMANNPDWCRPLSEWKEKLSEWIIKATPRELLDLSICLDFRTVYGAPELLDALRVSLYDNLINRPSFLPRLARNVLLFKPPPRLLGKIILSGPGKESGQLNIKEILMPIVGFGRLYALHHKMPHTHTLDRIQAIVLKGNLHSSAWEEVNASYDFLMQMRFKGQLLKYRDGSTLDNCIAVDKIGQIDKAILKQVFLQIESLQKMIAYDFLGGADLVDF